MIRFLFPAFALLLASGVAAAAAPDASPNPRTDLFNEDFVGAHTKLAAQPDTSEKRGLARVTDECELAALCDEAQTAIEANQKDKAAATLEDALKRLGGSFSSSARARGLLAIARTKPDDLKAYAGFFSELDKALKAGDMEAAERRRVVDHYVNETNKLIDETAPVLAAAQQAAASEQFSTAEKGFTKVEAGALAAREWILKIQPLVTADEYERTHAKIEARTAALLDAAAESWGNMYIAAKAYLNACDVLWRGVRRSPANRRLLDLYVTADELMRTPTTPK